MARGLNKVQLIGNLGADPEVRAMPSGDSVANLRIATSEEWKDKSSGEKRERTEWHRVVFFGKVADICQEYLHKGMRIYVEGKLQTQKWTDRDGNERYTTQIVGDQLLMLSGKTERSADAGQAEERPARRTEPARTTGDDKFDDDIPF